MREAGATSATIPRWRRPPARRRSSVPKGAAASRFGSGSAEAGLQGGEDQPIRAVDKGDDDRDDHQDETHVEVLLGTAEEIAKPGAAAEEFGAERDLPRHAEADPQRREHEGQQARQHDTGELAPAAA